MTSFYYTWVFLACILANCVAGQGQRCFSDIQCGSYGLVCDLQTRTCVWDPQLTCNSEMDCPSELYTCNTKSSICEKVSCADDANCYMDNSICNATHLLCTCKGGFSIRNSACEQTLGQECLTWNDCEGREYVCTNQKCQCDSRYSVDDKNNGICVHPLGRSCNTSTDCGTLLNMECSEQTCKCKRGYMPVNDQCRQVLYRSCSNDTDCPLANAYCNGYSCRCLDGAIVPIQNEPICLFEVGESCDNVYCDRRSLYGSANTYCNKDYICSCRVGYTETDRRCVSALNKECNNTETDCGSEYIYDCQDSICHCGPGFIGGIDTSGTSVCVTELGQNCTIVNCSGVNAVCDGDGICSCISGYMEHLGRCVPLSAMPCQRNEECSLRAQNAICDTTCKCKAGFEFIDNVCTKVHGKACVTNVDCAPEDHLLCISGLCTCDEEFPVHNDQCKRKDCHVDVRQIPWLDKRSPSYHTIISESVVDDSTLESGWYNIGVDGLATLHDDAALGDCGTLFPIYLKAPLSASQLDEMSIGDDVGLVVIGGTEELNVKMRKCGDDYHVFINQNLPRISALCIDNSIRNADIDYYYEYYVRPINAALYFRTEERSGQNYDVPYVKFTCQSYIPPHNEGDIFINWYIDKKLFKRNGQTDPSEDMEWNVITEEEIIQGNVITFGFSLQCSVELKDRYGTTISHSYNKPLYTGVYMTDNYLEHEVSSNIDTYLHKLTTRIPLGCATLVGDTSWNCTLQYGIKSEDGLPACSSSVQEPHRKCGTSLLGFTKYGYENHYKYYNYNQGASHGHINHFVNGTYTTTTYLGTHIQLDDTLQNSEGSENNFLKATFGEPIVTTGHELWQAYQLPDMMQHLRGDTERIPKPCYAYSTELYIGHHMFGHGYPSIGTYLIYRSDTVPVEIQIRTEKCKDNYGICLCAMTVRNDDQIFTEFHCGGLHISGSISGPHLSNDNMALFQLKDGTQMNIHVYPYNQLYSGLEAYVLMSGQTEAICSIEDGKYRKRDGTFTHSAEEFMESWKLKDDEDLLHTAAHVKYSWSETFYPCNCPSVEDNVPISTIDKTYMGALKCTINTVCTNDIDGQEPWPASLMPDYTIREVNVLAEMDKGNRIPVVRFKCNFKGGSDNYFYKIKWNAGSVTIHTTGLMSPKDATETILSDQFIIDNTNYTLVLDSEIECGVAVFSSTDELLLNFQFSAKFRPVEIVTTDVTMLRGGDSVVSVRINLPYPPTFRGLRFSLYDPDDTYDCSNSTIAVKTSTTCGAIWQESNNKQGESISMIITNKNNNKYSLKTRFQLKLLVNIVGHKAPSIFSGEFNKHITATVTDGGGYWQKRYCYVSNDPRVVTADGTYYSYYTYGEHIMLRHKRLQFEVQVKTRRCNGRGSCSCGVAIRAGRDVFVINHCSDTDHIVGFTHRGDDVLIVRRRTQNRYQIYLPHGTFVDVQVFSWRWYLVNVYIYPSPSDVGQIEGLCGNFNGKRNDDLVHRDGSSTAVNSWWYFNPTEFVESWKLGSYNAETWTNESLLHPNRTEESFLAWSEDEEMCVCPNLGNDIAAEAVCSANEERTCSKDVDRPGVVVDNSNRKTRSVDGRRNDIDIKHRLTRMHQETLRVHAGIVKRDAVGEESNMTYEEATTECENALRSTCPLYNIQEETPARDIPAVTDCAQDLLLNPNVRWDNIACTHAGSIIEEVVSNDIEFQEVNPSLTTEIKDQVKCIGNCSNNGECIGEDKCSCFDGFGIDDCSLDVRKPVQVLNTQGGGYCDKNIYDDCSRIRLTTKGHLLNASCKVIVKVANFEGPFRELSAEEIKGNCGSPNMFDIECCWEPTNLRIKRATKDDAAIYEVGFAISNNGAIETFGSTEYVFVLDTTCQEVKNENGTSVAHLKTGFCFIQGVCYPEGGVSSTDPCDVCDPSATFLDWTSDKTLPGCTPSTTDANQDTPVLADEDNDTVVYMIIGSVVGAFVLITTVIIVAVIIKSKRKRGKESERYSAPRHST